MKVSVSLPDDDVHFLDAYANRKQGSRSAVLHEAIALLRLAELEDAYANAADESADEVAVWETALGDGLDDAPR